MATLLNNSCAYKRPSGTCAESPTLLWCKSGEIHGAGGVLEALHPPARPAQSSSPGPRVPSFTGSAHGESSRLLLGQQGRAGPGAGAAPRAVFMYEPGFVSSEHQVLCAEP